MILETYLKLWVTEPDFPEKKKFNPNIGKMDQNLTKTGFF